MKLSKYNYIINSKNEILIWNTIRGSLMTFTQDYYNNLINEKFDLFTDEEIKVLTKNGILIEDNVVELDNVLNRKQELKNSSSSSYTIALTQNCNAHCYYCYQSESVFENNRKLIKNDYDKIVDFIIKTKKDKVKITWFGGEPLIRSDIIAYISEKLINKNVNLESVIITNGLLLSSLDINTLKNKWKICEIQVTFDGLYQNHDKRKCFAFGKNNFEKIIEKFQKSKNTILDQKCIQCVFLPICQGGCIRNDFNECPQFIDNVVGFLKHRKEGDK